MTKLFRKNIYWIVLTLLLAGLLFWGIAGTDRTPAEPQSEQAPLSFAVEGGGASRPITAYVDENENYRVFLPSYARMEQVTVEIAEGTSAALDGTLLTSGADCSGWQTEREYALTLNGESAGTLRFYRSANVASLYIDTLSGTMDQVHADKEYEETATVALYTADGALDYESAMCSIKGRGNATWGYAKKPYVLKLPNYADLMGMGAASDWILLANATDETNLHNKLVFDLAEQAGMDWVPENAFVDVYLNGEYNGLYLLTERIESGENRLMLDTSRGDFLGKIDLRERWDDLRNPLLTAQGRTVEIGEPRLMGEGEPERIEALVNRMEELLLSGEDLAESGEIDLDSWVRRYLIDEISGNIDSDLASSYFYYADGVFCAGPVWDYDRTFGNSLRNQEPTAFLAKNAYKSDGFVSPYYSALYENESFYRRMTEIYREEFLPILEEWLDGGIEAYAESIAAAKTMNDVRWKSMFDLLKSWSSTIIQSTEDLTGYVNERVSFLNDVWVDGKEYCTVQFERSSGETYWNISVEKGSLLETPYIEKEPVWLVADTGEVFDFSQPILDDVILTVPAALKLEPQPEVQPPESSPEPPAEEEKQPLTREEKLTLLSVVVLVLLLIVLAAVDRTRRRKERRGADERTRTRISS